MMYRRAMDGCRTRRQKPAKKAKGKDPNDILVEEGRRSNLALSLDKPPVAIFAKRGSLLSDRDLNCPYGSVAMMAVTAAD